MLYIVSIDKIRFIKFKYMYNYSLFDFNMDFMINLYFFRLLYLNLWVFIFFSLFI